MSMHSNQRVGVFVDVQNLYYSAKNLYHAKVNFRNILRDAVGKRQLIRAFCYVIKADMKDEHSFHEALEKIGYEVRSKDLQVFYGGAKKGDWDVGIAMDMIRLAPKLDSVVLVSGDGDFKDLLEYLQAHGCRAEVMAFKRTASSRILEICDRFVDMDQNPREYIISGDERNVRGHYKIDRTLAPAQKEPFKTAIKEENMPVKPLPELKIEEKKAEKPVEVVDALGLEFVSTRPEIKKKKLLIRRHHIPNQKQNSVASLKIVK